MREQPRILSLSLPVLACVVTGSGRVVEQARTVSDFSSIEVSAGIQAKIEAGPKSALTLRGEDNILPHVRTDIRGSTLQIGFERGLSIRTRTPVVVSLRVPRLDGISASGGSRVEASVPSGESLRLEASGGAHIQLLAEVKPRRLDLRASGGGGVAVENLAGASEAEVHGAGGAVISLAGKASELTLAFSGGTVVEADRLKVGSLQVDGSGGGVAKVRLVGSARGQLSGGTTLHLGRAATTVEVATSGGAEVIR